MLVGNVFCIMHTILTAKILCFSIKLKSISLEDVHLHHQQTCIEISNVVCNGEYYKHDQIHTRLVKTSYAFLHSNCTHAKYCYWQNKLQNKHIKIKQGIVNEKHSTTYCQQVLYIFVTSCANCES